MSDDTILECCLDLMRRLPPQNIEKNLSAIIDLTPPEMITDILSSIDQSPRTIICKETKRPFLACDYNRDGDSYRSPWSNLYNPPLPDGAMPSKKLRELEVKFNSAFEHYRDLYFDGGVSSCYLWDIDDNVFAGVLVIKKAGEGSEKVKGCWDSIHVFEVEVGKTSAKYKLTSTLMLWLQTNKSSLDLNLGGSLTRQVETELQLSKFEDHVPNVGQLVEDMENKMRQTMSTIYFGKTKDIVNGLRSMTSVAEEAGRKKLQEDLAFKLKNRQ